MTISERIFDIMKQRGMTQKEFSQRTGIPQSTISDWKGKGVNPAADKVMVISDVLGVDPVMLLSGTESNLYEKPDYLMIGRKTEECFLVEAFRDLDEGSRKRVLGYLEALKKVDK